MHAGSVGGAGRRRWAVTIVLIAIILLAAGLRLAKPGASPPGLYTDESANIWASWCLLKTGRDDNGVRWPIFFTRGLGENRSTLYVYWLMPFLASGGLEVTAARAASAAAGVLSVALAYVVGAGLWNRGVGLLAAALMAIAPWSVYVSRWAHESSLVPLAMLLPLAAMLWAGLPIAGATDARPPRPLRAVLAGLATGIACYGYPPVRIVLPLVIAGLVLVSWRTWRRFIQSREGARAAAGFVLAFAATFGPLAYQHLVHGEQLNRRGAGSLIYEAGDPLTTRIGKILASYAGHFAPRFLFERGDADAICFVPGRGLFGWYMAPMMAAGLWAALRNARRSHSARILLLLLALYPAGDLVRGRVEGTQTHALRSLPGLPAMILLAAVGGMAAWDWLGKRNRRAAIAVAAGMAVASTGMSFAFYAHYFGAYNRSEVIEGLFSDYLVKALRFARPRIRPETQVFVTIWNVAYPHPHSQAMVELQYDPHAWLTTTHEIYTSDPDAWRALPGADVHPWKQENDLHTSVGNLNFLFFDRAKTIYRPLLYNDVLDHVILILRPDEPHPDVPLVFQVRRDDGTIVMNVYEGEI